MRFSEACRRTTLRVLPIVLLLLALQCVASANAKRLVLVKVDGLPYAEIERYVREREPRTGKSRLPWIEHVFYERGTRVANFYVRGMSLSGPSWSLLDTGRHLQIKGNVEFDRYTLHSYDYLNFIPFWLGNAGGMRVDMPGVELLDELGLPLLADAYPYDERHLSFQLYQRGARWTSLQRGLQNRFTSRTPRELFDEWNTGFEARSILMEQMERELLEKLTDPKIRYLDFYTTDFDHAAHHNRDSLTHFRALQELDAQIGRVWTAIQKTPLAPETALVLVSDHGTNSDERIYSQGFNLVKLLGTAAGGGHHVVTKRRLLNDYALKGIYPLVPLIYTTTEESYYLKGQSTVYPTALVDFDGNERAAIHLRDGDLNLLHILLQQLQRKELNAPLRAAATEAFFSALERRREAWRQELASLNEELDALRRSIEKQRAHVAMQPQKWTQADRDAGRDKTARREVARLNSWTRDEREYTAYARALANLLALERGSFNPAALRIEDVIAGGAMGLQNSVHQLQNYVVGTAREGLLLTPDGSLDMEKSFVRVNYFALLRDTTVRNNVQPGVLNRPVDFVAVRIPAERMREALGKDLQSQEVIWLDGGRERQALILGREDEDGKLHLRYLPIANLTQDARGRVTFERMAWGAGFPLKIWEDVNFQVSQDAGRAAWLDKWHTDIEWLRAMHLTQYSNAVIGLHEQLGRHVSEGLEVDAPGISAEERMLRRFRARRRRLVETDLLILANNHWNFDVRGFNPGGNHGSFFRVSTHSTLMLAGGEATKIPRAFVVEEPYDSLSFIPTMLALTGSLPEGPTPAHALRRQASAPFPGRIIGEIFAQTPDGPRPVARTFAKGDAP